jgi:transcriptional regulator with XRE-family HTH domain
MILGVVVSRVFTQPKLNHCGPWVKKLRTGKGWSQAKYASKCQLQGWDISKDIIVRIELQIRVVTDWELLTLAKVLGVEPNDLLGA